MHNSYFKALIRKPLLQYLRKMKLCPTGKHPGKNSDKFLLNQRRCRSHCSVLAVVMDAAEVPRAKLMFMYCNVNITDGDLCLEPGIFLVVIQ